MSPLDLQLRVGAILLEATVARGSDCVEQIRRSYLSIEVGKNGEEVARIRGNVKKKTMQGRSANFEPMDVTVTGKEEVAAIEKLLNRVAENGSNSTRQLYKRSDKIDVASKIVTKFKNTQSQMILTLGFDYLTHLGFSYPLRPI